MASRSSPTPGESRDHSLEGGAHAGSPSPTDAELVARMAGGNAQALRELYRRLAGLIYSVALRIGGVDEDAEETLVDSFHQAWAHAGLYDPSRGTVTGWIVNIARSRAIDRLRAHHRRQRGRQALSESAATFPPYPAANPEHEAIRSEERERLHRVIAALPPDQKRALELAYFSGLSHTQIAERLGMPLGTVKTRLRLAMEKIRSALAGVEGMRP